MADELGVEMTSAFTVLEQEEAAFNTEQADIADNSTTGMDEAYMEELQYERGIQLAEDRGIAAEGAKALEDLRAGVAAQFDGDADKYTVFESVIANENGNKEELAAALIELNEDVKAGWLSDESLEVMNAALPAMMAQRYLFHPG